MNIKSFLSKTQKNLQPLQEEDADILLLQHKGNDALPLHCNILLTLIMVRLLLMVSQILHFPCTLVLHLPD